MRVPGGIVGKWLLNRTPSHHLSKAPRLAPAQIARTDFHMSKCFPQRGRQTESRTNGAGVAVAMA